MTQSTDDNSRPQRDFGDAAKNFQDAAEEFAASAANQASERAADILDEAAARLRGEGTAAADEAAPAGSGSERRDAGRRARRSHRSHRSRRRRDAERGYQALTRRPRRLYRDAERRRIAGVCAGIANYFGVETWVTRCVAVVGLIFMGQVTLPAYLVAWVVMERAPGPGEPSRHRRRRGLRMDMRMRGFGFGGPRADRGADSSESAERSATATFSPRGRLRALQADAGELELRLRRMETHVTSGQYELQRELRNIEEN